MSISQEAFASSRSQSYEGMASDCAINDIPTVHNYTGDHIGYGLFVVADKNIDPNPVGGSKPNVLDGKNTAKLPSAAFTAADVLGVTVRTMANEQAAYADKSPMSAMREGRMFVKCMDGCARRSSVHVSYDPGLGLGRVYGAAQAGKTVELENVMFLSTASGGDIVEIQLNGIM